MKDLPCLLAAAICGAGLIAPLGAQSIVSEPLGFNTVVCPVDSDTIVGVPFRPNGSQQGALAAAPDTTTIPGSAILSIAGNPAFGTLANHYAKFTSGALDGRFYAITANTAATLTVDLNNDTMAGAAANDGILVAEFWTLDTLFPPDQSTTAWTETPAGSGNWVPNGHAIVRSTGTGLLGRRSEVFFPDKSSAGINLAAKMIFYINGSLNPPAWVSATNNPNPGQTQIWPDTYIVIRHPVVTKVAHATNFKTSGEVEMGRLAVPLSTLTDRSQDNAVAIPRPIDLRLNQLNLFESGAFVPSIGTSLIGRRDQLLVYNNAIALRNKAASAIYYHNGTNWINSSGNVIADDAVLAASAGMIIRKFKTSNGFTVYWDNTASYNP